MGVIDIHTHLLPEVPGTALACIGCGPLPVRQGDWLSAGLHPWDVTGQDESQFQALEQLLSLPQVKAVGECGFDTLRGPSHELQEQAFIRQVELSERTGKPVILHVVRDFDSVVRLRRQIKPRQQWLIHGFRGGPEQMNQLYAQGILVSFGLNYNPQSLKNVPSDRLFLETDGKDSIMKTVSLASAVRGESMEAIIRQVTDNSALFLLI